MPTLNWIGKEAVVKHHKDVPFRLLEPVADRSCGPANSGNLIVQGDNLHALKALLPRYADWWPLGQSVGRPLPIRDGQRQAPGLG